MCLSPATRAFFRSQQLEGLLQSLSSKFSPEKSSVFHLQKEASVTFYCGFWTAPPTYYLWTAPLLTVCGLPRYFLFVDYPATYCLWTAPLLTVCGLPSILTVCGLSHHSVTPSQTQQAFLPNIWDIRMRPVDVQCFKNLNCCERQVWNDPIWTLSLQYLDSWIPGCLDAWIYLWITNKGYLVMHIV